MRFNLNKGYAYHPIGGPLDGESPHRRRNLLGSMKFTRRAPVLNKREKIEKKIKTILKLIALIIIFIWVVKNIAMPMLTSK